MHPAAAPLTIGGNIFDGDPLMRTLARTSLVTLLLLSQAILAAQSLPLTVEEKRLPLVAQQHPEFLKPFAPLLEDFGQKIARSRDYASLESTTRSVGEALWQQATNRIKKQQDFDDRPLYWSRLAASKMLRNLQPEFEISDSRRRALLDALEWTSRGKSLAEFPEADYRILLTGFDPFFLDRNLDQSNPSGVAAMMLDGSKFNIGDRTVAIETALFPVRFEDFDRGDVEAFLTPYYRNKTADMVTTISMGRDDFDLENFPGKRRSANAFDNLNILTGASATNPLIPKLGDAPLEGSEFVEFSLPADAMMTIQTPWAVNDNHQVTTLTGDREPESLQELDGETSVQGSGGGYLSNEISYRSINLANQLGVKLPIGHIHTPRISPFDRAQEQAIVEQIRELLKAAAKAEMEQP